MKDKIQYFEIATLIYFSIRASFIGIGLNCLLFYGKVDSWICALLGTILGLIPLLFYLAITKIDKEKNIHEIIKKIFGNTIGKIISFCLLFFVLFYAVILFYDIINFIASEYLYKTPSYIIGSMIIIPIIYLLTKGIRTICRVSIVLFIISMILYFFSVIGLIPAFDAINLLPILENGIGEPLKGSLIYVCYTALPLFILSIIPRKDMEDKKFNKKVIITFLLVALVTILALLNVVGVLGIDLALLYQYPDYQMLRRIQVGGFIQRTESILAIQWLLCLFMMISFCLYYCIKTTTFLFSEKQEKIKGYLPYLYPIITLVLSRLIWRNNTSFVNFTIKDFPIYIYVFCFGIPILLLLIYYIKKLKEKFSS